MKEIKIKLALILTASMVLNPFIPAYAGEIVELEEPVVQQEIATPVNADYVESDGVSDDQETDIPEEATLSNADTDETFIRETVVDGITITLTADPGVFPGEAELWAEQVEDEAAEEAIEEAVEKERDSNVNVVLSYKFDIKMFVNGEEVQPDTSKGSVKVTFTLEEELSECLDANAYHLKEEADGELIAENIGAEVKIAEESSESVKPAVFDEDGVLEDGVIEDDVTKKVTKLEAETDGFSYYVVEFTYNELQYVLSGDSSIKLSEILKTLAIEGTVSDAEVSNEELFTVTKDAENDDWTVAALQAFSTKEWMKVTINGQVYEIVVTDEQNGHDPVPYLTWDNDKKKLVEATRSEYIEITSGVDYAFEGGTWYVVKGDVKITNRITNNGTTSNPAHLILTDNCTFNVPAGIHNRAHTESSGGTDHEIVNELFIYGQTNNSGILQIDKAAENDAGIGGGNQDKGGTLTINGGTVNVTKTGLGAGIGGGTGGAGGTITINGGTVDATGGGDAAGIGGCKGEGGTITINGGTVNATGGSGGSGIGGGNYDSQSSGSAGGTIIIKGGTVDAIGGGNAAGIGGGHSGSGETITISNGTINATGGSGGAGIGGGNGGDGGTITISGGTVTAMVGLDTSTGGAGIGGGNGGKGGTIKISGGTVTALATASNGGAGIGGGNGKAGGTITISGGTVTALATGSNAGIGDGYNGSGGTLSIGNTPEILFAGQNRASSSTVPVDYYITNHQNYPFAFISYSTFNVDYKVEHYQQIQIKGKEYALVEGDTETKQGIPGYETKAKAKQYDGYSNKDIVQKTIALDGSTVVKVYYDIIHYTVTFNVNGHGSTPSEAYVPPNTTVNRPSDPEADGCDFAGWYTDQNCSDGKEYDFSTLVTKSITLYAKWKIVVRLDAQYGSGGTATVSVAMNSKMPKIDIPNRSGYLFGGYFTEKNGNGTRYYNADGTSARTWDIDKPNTTLYAYWISNPSPAHVHTPETILGQRATCTADGWKDYYQCSDSGCGKYFSDAACTATISDLDTWKIGEGKIAKTGHKQIHILQKDATTEADGYKEHWYCGNCKTYYSDSECANLIGNEDALKTWKAGDGKIEKKAVHTHTYGTATYYWSEDLTQCTGYHTCTESTCQYTEFETVGTVKGETQYTATFTKSGFTTQYKDIPIPTHVHTFAEGWTSNAIAHWHAATCEHKDVVSGFAEHTWGTGADASKCTVCGYEKVIPKPEKVVVNFNTNGGSFIVAQHIEKGSKAARPSNPTKEGYKFDNWYTDTSYSTLFDFTVVINNDTTVYAKWTSNGKEQYTITWKDYDGKLLATSIVDERDIPKYPKASKPSRSGYIFTGWTPEIDLAVADTTYTATYEKKSSGGGGGSGSGGGGGSGSGGGGGSGGGSAGSPSKITYEEKPAVTPITVAANGAQMIGTAVVSIPAAQLAENGAVPAAGAWNKENGMWAFTKADGNKAKNEWALITVAGGNASYFYFDSKGNMATGWQQIDGKWMYFNNESGPFLGACLIGPGRTPDGYEIDASGAWTGR